MNRQLLLLTLCQGLFFVNNVTFVAINGLVGLQLAPLGWMATLPLTAYVGGGALAAPLVARHQRAWGRRRCFESGLAVAIVSAGLCALAAHVHSFALLLLATALAGYYNANAQLYRFAATEVVAPAYKERAISWVLAGGIFGGVIGPNLANATRDALAQPFVGAYVALMVVAALAWGVMRFITFPPLHAAGAASAPTRSLRELARQPTFVVAIVAAALGYGVMNLLMAATPIAMQQCGHAFSAAALVLEAHVLAMFTPSFFTGALIRRIGVTPVLAAGALLNLGCVAFALSGQEVMHFTGALALLGVGWNFLYIGGTTLFTQTYHPAERTTAQAAMATTVLATMTVTSFSSGALVTTGGWRWMNLGTLVPVGATLLALVWLVRARMQARGLPAA